MFASCHLGLALAAVLAIAATDAAAQTYKWTDENGVVNYSNTPPPKKPGATAPTVVEEKISVYTPEQAVTDSLENARKRAAAPPPQPPVIVTTQQPIVVDSGGGRVGVIGPPPGPPITTYDPCAYPNNDPRCQVIYAPAPVVTGRRPVQLPPGTVTSNVGPSPAIVPGQPGLNNPQFPPPARGPAMRGRDPSRDRDTMFR